MHVFLCLKREEWALRSGMIRSKRKRRKLKWKKRNRKKAKARGGGGRRRMLVCRRWTGRWPRHWFLLVFIDHVPSLLGRLCPLTEILAWDGRRVESKKSAISHISYRGQHGFSSVSSKLAQGLPEDINQTVASAARRSSQRRTSEQKILERYDWRTDGNYYISDILSNYIARLVTLRKQILF